MNEPNYAACLVAIVQANPMIEIHCSNIADIQREVSELVPGVRLRSTPGQDTYDRQDKYGRWWEQKRFNPRKFHLTIEKNE